MRRRVWPAICAMLAGATPAAAQPAVPSPAHLRIAVVRPMHPDPVAADVATRLQAELTSAGFTVILVEAPPGGDPRTQVEAAADTAQAAAAVTIVRGSGGAPAEVWVADHLSHKTLVRRLDRAAPSERGHAPESGESTEPAALAIHAVELLRASLLEDAAAPPTGEVAPAPPPASPSRESDAAPEPAARPRSPPNRALLAGLTVELGLAALYGLGDTSGRLAPTLRFAYGTPAGLAGRLTVMGPTSSDQLGLVEIAYGFGSSFRIVAPVVALGAGAYHVHLDDTADPRVPHLRTEAWAGAFSASGGVAVRAVDRAAFLVDAHAILVQPAAGALVDMAPAGGRPELLVTASLGVVAGF